MPVAGGKCPNCGAAVEFRSGSSLTLVCGSCKQVVVRTDRTLEGLGTVADVAATEHSLALRDRGSLGGRPFEVLGRVVLRHPQGGSWEQYHLRYDDGSWAWVDTAQGRWSEVALTREVWLRPLGAVHIGERVRLGSYGDFTVTETNAAVFESASGELPFAVRPGQLLTFVDLSGPNGSVASVHYLDLGGQHQVFVGHAITRADLHLQARVGDAPVQAVPMASIRCNNCGGDLPARVDPGALHVVCPYCNAIADHATHQVIARQERSRALPKLMLGLKGNLAGAEWTVIGYLERSSSVEGEGFWWCEYLLYNRERGYRWVIEDEGVWYLATPVPAGDVDASQMPRSVRYNNRVYQARNAGTAMVDRVLGEFYWRVTVGERVLSRDFTFGQYVLACEDSGTERNWTIAEPVPAATLFHAFGLPVPAPIVAWKPPPKTASSQEGVPGWLYLVLGVVLIFVFASFVNDDDDDTPGGGGHGSIISFGGFGGK